MISTLQRMYRHFYFRLCDIVDTAALSDLEGNRLRGSALVGQFRRDLERDGDLSGGCVGLPQTVSRLWT